MIGWRIDETLSIENERLLIALPTQGQYLNVRALDDAMVPTSYGKVQAEMPSDSRVQLDARGVQSLYGGRLTTFRLRFLLPLAIEVQHIGRGKTQPDPGQHRGVCNSDQVFCVLRREPGRLHREA